MAKALEIIKKVAKAFDNGLLKYSSTKLGQTDYDSSKVYDQEERKITVKDIWIILAVVLGFTAFATLLVLFVLT